MDEKLPCRGFGLHSDSKSQDVTDSQSREVKSIKVSEVRQEVNIGVYSTKSVTREERNRTDQPELVAAML